MEIFIWLIGVMFSWGMILEVAATDKTEESKVYGVLLLAIFLWPMFLGGFAVDMVNLSAKDKTESSSE